MNPYANPALASAGTGDVLSGVIAGLLAQGLSPFDAACCGAYVHAAAAEGLRGETGDAGLLAGDLLPELPRTMRELRGLSLGGARLAAMRVRLSRHPVPVRSSASGSSSQLAERSAAIVIVCGS